MFGKLQNYRQTQIKAFLKQRFFGLYWRKSRKLFLIFFVDITNGLFNLQLFF